MVSTLATRCANDPKDFSFWNVHKDTFRRLFLTDGRSLGEVKALMEASGFPKTNVKTYEVVLREHFKFRKNLEAGQWLLVGKELDKWKSQGLDYVVSLSGITQDLRLVNKKIRRERAEAARGKLKYWKSQRFPDAVTITPKMGRTLEVAGSMSRNTANHLESSLSLTQEPDPTSTNLSTLISLSDQRLSQEQLSNDVQIVGLQVDFVEHILQNPISKVYETLRTNVPSRELICFLRGLWETERLSPRARSVIVDSLFRFINSTRNMPPCQIQGLPDPRLFGLNDSFSVLEKACTSFCNGYSSRFDKSLLSPLRRWLATVADIGVLQQFFSIPKPAVAAMWVTFIWTFYSDQSTYSILIEVALRVHRGRWLHRDKRLFLGNAILLGAQSTAERVIDAWQVSAGTVEPWALSEAWPKTFDRFPANAIIASVPLIVRLYSKLHAPRQVLDTTISTLFWQLGWSQAAAVHWLVEEGAKIQPAISDWIPSCAQQLPPEWKPAWAPEQLSPGDLGEVFRGDQAPKPSCKNIFEIFVPFLGILASARNGREALRRFMGSLSTDGPPARKQLLRLALAETTRQHDIATTELLLETGLYVNMEPFCGHRSEPDLLRQRSDPVLRSAVRSETAMLKLLLNHRLFEDYSVSDVLQTMSGYCPLDQSFKWRPTIDFLLEREGSTLKDIWDEVPDSEDTSGQVFILDYVHRRISRQRAPYMEPQDLLCTIFPNDTLRKAITHGFNIETIESLVAAGIPIPPGPAENGNTLLIDALLTRSKDRYQIVHLLLRNGADPRMSSPEFTVLEATLWIQRGVYIWNYVVPDDDVTLDLFRELGQLGAPLKREVAPITPFPLPLLSLLIQYRAGIPLLEQTAASGAQINEHGTEFPWTPLVTAIWEHQPDTVKWLLEQGADVNVRPCRESIEMLDEVQYPNYTPLEHAIAEGDMDLVILLLSYGAIINNSFENVFGGGEYRRLYNAVDLAVCHSRLDILKVLVDSGGQSAYPGLSGLDGAFWEADESDRPGIMMFLEQYTGWSEQSILKSMKERLESGELWTKERG